MTPFYLLTGIVCSVYAGLMLWYLYCWKRTADSTNSYKLESGVRLSIIIPVRNEEQNILTCLASVYRQEYPQDQYEVIVVDDHSSDKTAEIVSALNYPNLKLIRLAENQTGKKQAITQGVGVAFGDLMVTTDADCTMGEKWLSGVVSFYEEQKPRMIAGPVLLKNEKGFQQILQSQEMTVLTACACASMHAGLPILCSGANLAYEKGAFMAVNGFEGVDKTASGDDVFLMEKMNKKFPGEIQYIKSLDAVVYTNAAHSLSLALKQRKRWASKGLSYTTLSITSVAIIVFLANIFIVFSGIMSAINLKFVFVPAACFSAKILVDFMLLYSASSFFNKKFHPFVFFIASLIYPVYVSIMGLVSPFSNYSWKSRKS